MIYVWIGTLFHICKSIRHFFRKFVCKDYYIEAHGLARCGKYGASPDESHVCKYYWCPKRIGADDE